MATYLVLKRMKEDRWYMPDEILVDPDMRVSVLQERGFLQVVPDNYTVPVEAPRQRNSTPAKQEPEEADEDETTTEPEEENRPATYEEYIEAGYSDRAATALVENSQDPDDLALIEEESKILEEIFNEDAESQSPEEEDKGNGEPEGKDKPEGSES